MFFCAIKKKPSVALLFLPGTAPALLSAASEWSLLLLSACPDQPGTQEVLVKTEHTVQTVLTAKNTFILTTAQVTHV